MMRENDAKETKQEEVIIGARALGEQINKIMPTYQVMLKQLKDIRDYAAKSEYKDRNQSTRKQDINNTIGIFGQRGTGKSSALYTLREELEKSQDNILLPLIEPDNFGGNTKIIGSIVGFLQAEGNKLLKALEKKQPNSNNCTCLNENRYYNNGTLIPNNPLKQIINETIEYHLYTESQYRSVLNHHYEDLATHIKKSSRLLIPDIAFKNKLNELIDEIVCVKKALNKCEDTVLIYIFIDDIDLKTSKTRELMDALLQYTNHPNIVTVLSGDYDILKESLTLTLLADEPLQEVGLNAHDSLKLSESEPLTILKRKAELAHEYLKKIIPSAMRYQLVKWNEETIPFFAFGEATLLSQLAKLMGEQSIFSYKETKRLNENGREAARDTLPIKKSYTIFDERPRGIVHAYYHLVQLLRMVEGQPSEADKFSYVKVFVDTLILSNKKLLEQQELIFEQCLRWGSDAKSSFIDYSVQFSSETDLGLELLIIGRIIRYLLQDVKYDAGAYELLIDRVFSSQLLLKSDKNKDIVQKFSPYGWNYYPIYHMMRGLVLNTDFRSAMLMLEYLSQSSFDAYYYEHINDEARDQKDRFVVLQVAKLIEQDPRMLEQLYRKSHIEKVQLVNYTLNTLHDLCIVNPDFEKTKREFQGVLRNFILKNPTNTGEENENFNLKRDLFTNNITMIRKAKPMGLEHKDARDLHGSVTIIARDKFHDFAHALNHLIELLSNRQNNNVPNSVLQTVEIKMKKFSEHLFQKIWNNDIRIRISFDKQNSHGLKSFFENYAGNNTIYLNCKHFVYAKFPKLREYLSEEENEILTIETDFQSFKDAMSKVKSLAENNRVWFGQQEAREFLVVLKNSSSIAEDYVFEGNDKFILELYYKYIISTQEFLEDEDYEIAKRFIKKHLDEAYGKVRNRTETELKEFNLSLEDAEEEASGETNAGQN